MTLKRDAKRVQRAIRNIPIEQVAQAVAAWERDGRWCLVAGELMFVAANGSMGETNWDDPLELAQFIRYVQAHPERVHPTHKAALEFVRTQLG